jgi:transposase
MRRIRHLPMPEAPSPRVVGIDDWAQRKGQTYGTIIVDLEQRCPVDVLPDRSAESVATWLKGHPEVTIVTRDRAEAYTAGVTQGAPDAIQVADRWHLLKNLREAVEAELHQRPTLPWRLPPTTRAEPPMGIPGASATADLSPCYPATPSGRRLEAARQARRTRCLHQYQQACTLRQQGLPLPGIARQVGVSTRTLCRWLAAETFPERRHRTGDTSSLDPYTAYLQHRWE